MLGETVRDIIIKLEQEKKRANMKDYKEPTNLEYIVGIGLGLPVWYMLIVLIFN